MTNISITRLALSAIMVSALAACGGGGGSAEVSAPINTSPGDNTSMPNTGTPASTADTIAHEVPTSTYAAGSPEAVIFDALNAERVRCGFGAVSQSTAIDRASAAHVDYLLGRYAQDYVSAAAASPHIESPAYAGFTGQTSLDRIRYQQYPASTSSTTHSTMGIAATTKPLAASAVNGQALSTFRSLLTSVYHARELFNPYRDVGISFKSGPMSTGTTAYVMDQTFGLPQGTLPQAPAAGTLRSYPCEGTSNALPQFRPSEEWPNPAPDLAADSLVGTPIYVAAAPGSTLLVTGATVRDTNGVASTRLITSATDTTGFIAPHEVFVLPLRPLAGSVTVAILATIDGQAKTLEFSFTPL